MKNALFALLLIISTNVSALTPAEVFKKVSPAVVTVFVFDDTGKRISMGSGVSVLDGKVATACHVVQGGHTIGVGSRNSLIAAEVWGGVLSRDVCLLTPKTRFKAVSIAGPSSMSVGDTVFAVGSPKQQEQTMTKGIISQFRGPDKRYIQTDAAISSGSSGGGLFNDRGVLIGIVVYMVEGGQNLNVAVSADVIKQIKQGSVQINLPETTTTSIYAR